MSAPDPTREAQVLSLREAAHRLIEQSRHEVFMDNRRRVSEENWCALRDALAADEEERKEIVAVLREARDTIVTDGDRCSDPACGCGGIPQIVPRLSALLRRLEARDA